MLDQTRSLHRPSERHLSRVGAVAAVAGLVLYGASAVAHPGTPPQETEAAFADYASEPYWALIHLTELLGFLLFTVAAIALAWRLRRGTAGSWAMLGGAAMLVSATLYAVFTAVDGVALGVMVDRWAGASSEQQDLLYETAFAVRQIEAGLFSLRWLMFGLGAGLFAAAFFTLAKTPVHRRWMTSLGLLSVVASIGTLAFGVVQAETGFSDTSMAFQTGLYPPVIWLVAVAVFLYRHPEDPLALDDPQAERLHRSATSDAPTRTARVGER